MDVDGAIATQLANIEKRTGTSLAELERIVRSCGPAKHGEIRDFLKRTLGMGHGDANTLVHAVAGSHGGARARAAESAGDDPLDAIYAGPKAALRPIHAKILQAVEAFGPFERAPKKSYVSLRRKKQFAMVGPATNSRVEVGLNLRETKGTARLVEQSPGGMCQYKVRLGDAGELDAELIGWLRKAYDAAG